MDTIRENEAGLSKESLRQLFYITAAPKTKAVTVIGNLQSQQTGSGGPQMIDGELRMVDGGEGLVLGEYVRAKILLGRNALAEGDVDRAFEHFEAANHPPQSLNEARHLLSNNSNIEFWLGEACSAAGDEESAKQHWNKAERQRSDFHQMQIRTVSEMTYWSAMALRRLGRNEEAVSLFEHIFDYATSLEKEHPKIDYFATSLPTMLIFQDDLQKRQHITATFLKAQALLGLGQESKARAALDEVQRLDRSHAGARDLLIELTARRMDR